MKENRADIVVKTIFLYLFKQISQKFSVALLFKSEFPFMIENNHRNTKPNGSQPISAQNGSKQPD